MKANGIFENNVKRQLFGFDFNNKRCLDIGSRDGLNCITLVNFGAKEVIGIDLDNTKFHLMPKNNNVKLIKQDLLTYCDKEKFDIITCFLWNMSAGIYEDVGKKLVELLKHNGSVYISVCDDAYKNPWISSKDINGKTTKNYYDKIIVTKLLERYFNSVDVLNKDDSVQLMIHAYNPINLINK